MLVRLVYIVLAAAIGLVFWRGGTPAPVPADAPAAKSSATRAYADIKAIAVRPHPVGTPDHERVQAYLLRRLSGLGLKPELQSERTIVDTMFGKTVSAPVTNIIAVLKGKDSGKPAVLLMSHYDSVPDSPGAADDTAGVASTLEILRAMKSGPQPERDIIFVFTDGEELGLVGASAFFRSNPLAKHAGVAINFEARGDSGPAAMFETGPLNADTVALWARQTPRPSANSLSRAIYKRMPNGTDFTHAIEHGLPGVNIAFLGDQLSYHTMLATPEHLNLGSVQQMGDEGLAAARAFSAQIPQQKADAVYADVLGFFVIQYSFMTGWILLAIAAALVAYAIYAAQRAEAASWWRGLAGLALGIVIPVALLVVAPMLFTSSFYFTRMAHIDVLLAGAVAMAVGGAMLGVSLAGRRAALWQCFLVLNLLFAALAQVFLPEGAFVFLWPTLAAALLAILRYRIPDSERMTSYVVAIVSALFVAMAGCAAVFVFNALGIDAPAVVFAYLLSVMPLLLLLRGQRLPWFAHGALAAVGVALFAYASYAPFTAERPAPSLIRHVADLDSGKAYRADYLNQGDAWTTSALGKAQYSRLPWSEHWSNWWAPVAAVPVPKTDIALSKSNGVVSIVVTPAPGAYSVSVAVRSKTGFGASMLDGRKLAAIGADSWHELSYLVPGPRGVVWNLPLPKAGQVDVKVTTLYLAWPKDAAKLPPLPADKMRFGNSESTETVLRRSLAP